MNFVQVNLVSGDLVLNHGNSKWWSFQDIDASDVTGCGEFAGPMAIIVSEETPRKFQIMMWLLQGTGEGKLIISLSCPLTFLCLSYVRGYSW